MWVKGQAVTYDFFVASAIFLLAVTLLLTYWYRASLEIEEWRVKNFALEKLVSSSQVWFKEGYPKGWNESNVVELGLASEGEINQTKVNAMVKMGYGKVASLLSLGTWDLCFEVRDRKGKLLFLFPEVNYLGKKDVYHIERIAVWNGSPVVIKTVLSR